MLIAIDLRQIYEICVA